MGKVRFTLEDFDKFAEFIYRKTGIRFEKKKFYFLSKRIEKRMETLGIEEPIAYLRFLRFGDKEGRELQNLINLITVNETYFFREFPQLQAFAEHCLPEVVKRKAKIGDNRLKIWSAGCSTGEEPYTLSIILFEMLEDVNSWDIEILASDIDEVVLEKAREGIYEWRSVKQVPQEYFFKYFEIKGGEYKIKDEVKKLVKFEHLNLMDFSALRRRRGFDFIFCRNVLIYFDEISRKKVVDHFYIALNKGGYIFLGSSESVARITNAFKIKKMGGHIVYTKE